MSESVKGLTSSEVAERQREGKTNAAVTLKTKSIKRIFYDNICTLFNLINVVLFVSLLLVGSYKKRLRFCATAKRFRFPRKSLCSTM